MTNKSLGVRSARNNTRVVLGYNPIATNKPPHRQQPTGGVAYTHIGGVDVNDSTCSGLVVAS